VPNRTTGEKAEARSLGGSLRNAGPTRREYAASISAQAAFS
jgi:hypothetical protein